MSILDGKKLEKASDPTQEELEKEAKAWGFDTAEEFFKTMDEVCEGAHNGR